MCSQPLKILSRKADKNPVFDKLYNIVPCGHCEECKNEKRLSWFVRLYYEWQHCIDNNGFALFETLTYSNKSLPRVNNYACFCVEDCQRYIKRVRQTLVRLFPHVDIRNHIKYALFSEYGGKTHRPHYHLVWFVSCFLPRTVVRNVCASCWTEYFGFIKYGSRNCGFVDSVGGLKYCSKYVCKDVYEDKYLSSLTRRLRLDNSFSETDLKKLKPFTLCSNGLGLYALQISNYDMLENGSILMPDSKMSEKSYKLPLYYERKLFYDVKFRVYDVKMHDYVFYDRKLDIPEGVEFTPVYVLNDNGIKMKEKRFANFCIAARDVYRSSLLTLDYHLQEVNAKFNLEFKDSKDLHDFVFSLHEDVFVDYVGVYRGCVPAYGKFSVTGVHYDSSVLEDFITSLEVKNGFTFDKSSQQSFLNNLLRYKSIPDIDLKCDIIYYINSLNLRSFEKQLQADELAYVERKSVYLKLTEIYEEIAV